MRTILFFLLYSALVSSSPRALILQARSSGEAQCHHILHSGGRCRILLVHVHKSGGSTLCALAARNHQSVDFSENCQEQRNLMWHTKAATEQSRMLETSKHDFIAQEDVPLIDPPLPGKPSLFVISVRYPLDRILSHFRHHRRDGKLTNFSFSSFAARSASERDKEDYWAANWYVQLLGSPTETNMVHGERSNETSMNTGCFGEGFRCTEKNLENALMKLETFFSLVLIVDSSEHFRVAGHMLRRKFGWRADWNTDASRRGTKVSSSAAEELTENYKAYQLLLRQNNLDMRFCKKSLLSFSLFLISISHQIHLTFYR